MTVIGHSQGSVEYSPRQRCGGFYDTLEAAQSAAEFLDFDVVIPRRCEQGFYLVPAHVLSAEREAREAAFCASQAQEVGHIPTFWEGWSAGVEYARGATVVEIVEWLRDEAKRWQGTVAAINTEELADEIKVQFSPALFEETAVQEAPVCSKCGGPLTAVGMFGDLIRYRCKQKCHEHPGGGTR